MAAVTAVQDINDAMTAEIAAELGVSYSELSYIYDVSQNNFRQSRARYGVRPLSSIELNGVVKNLTHVQTFEVVLTEGYIESKIGDSKIQDKVFVASENMHKIFKRVVNNKAGVPATVLDISNLIISEPEILTEEKLVVLRASLDVMYRISLI